MYDVGDVYPAVAEVRDSSGTLVNATTMEFTFTLPDGTTTGPVTPANPSTGRYTYDLPLTQAGLHGFRAVSTGPATAIADVFNVASSSWPAFVGLAEVKAHLNIPATNTTYDDELRGIIASACEVVEDIIGPVTRRTVVETHSGGGPGLALGTSQILSITSVTESGRTVAASGYSLDGSVLSRVSGYYNTGWLPGTNNIVVTYVAGRTAVPWSVVDGTKELIRVNWRPQIGGNRSPFNQGGGDDFATGQGEIRLGFFVPNTVMQRLQPHGRAPLVA